MRTPTGGGSPVPTVFARVPATYDVPDTMTKSETPTPMKSNLAPHHLAWLETHPHRSEAWLRAMLKDGFDIHHLDGDHSNNDPENLCLIEHTDHMFLHGGRTLGRLGVKKGPRGPYKKKAGRSKRIAKPKAVQAEKPAPVKSVTPRITVTYGPPTIVPKAGVRNVPRFVFEGGPFHEIVRPIIIKELSE